MEKIITLDKLTIGEVGTISECNIKGSLKKRAMDLGFIKGNLIKCVGVSALGDPKAYNVFGSVLAIRKKDAQQILVCVE